MFLNICKNKIISIILQTWRKAEKSPLIFETLFDTVINKKIPTLFFSVEFLCDFWMP